jgi:uncharacterized protein (TIGR02246 family)
MSDNVDRRLRHLEDRQELQDLVARYCIAMDDQDFTALAGLYTADAVYVGPRGRHEGREQVVGYLRETASGVRRSIHTVHQQLVEFGAEDEATGIVTGHVEMSRHGADETLFGGMRYRDRYLRDAGQWRFLERDLTFVHLGPWSMVGSSLTGDGAN